MSNPVRSSARVFAAVLTAAALFACRHHVSTPTDHVAVERDACSMMYSADTCESDADCAAGTDCVCDFVQGGAGSPGTQNVCRHSSCRTDADCGPEGFCSPSRPPSCTGLSIVDGYFCHRPDDDCGTDADCGADGHCYYAAELGHWTCWTGPLVCGGG